jgi:hypothetical protein
MRIILLILCSSPWAFAHDYRVLVDGAGCRTRQLAIQRAFAAMPGVRLVEILPLSKSPALNQRYFIIRSSEKIPNRDRLIEALGRRAKFYHVQTIEILEPKRQDASMRAESLRQGHDR